jgi:zinc protease
MKNEKFKMKNSKLGTYFALFAFCIFNFAFLTGAQAQEAPPAPSAPKTITIPAVKEKKLPNGLTVAVVERKNVPLVTVQLLVKSGAAQEEMEKAGLANVTAALLTKGTKTRTASQIAEQLEFLGGSIASGAGWNNSFVTVNVMSDKLDAALAIMADVIMNAKFEQKEIDLLKSQLQDNLAYNLKQPGFLANYTASVYSFREHPAGGTPASVEKLAREDIWGFYQNFYFPQNMVLIFAGDITAAAANQLAARHFGKLPKVTVMESPAIVRNGGAADGKNAASSNSAKGGAVAGRLLVVDLPDAGQAAVNYLKNLSEGRVEFAGSGSRKTAEIFYPALVMNSVFGGGYSSRLNQEIRIKRGLSYGAGSSFAWRTSASNFGARTQTKNESAAEVAELMLEEINKLMEGAIAESELVPRKSVLTGDFGRDLETTGGLADAIASLYTFGLPTSELNSHMQNVRAVSDAQIRQFAAANLKGGDIIIVGDYAKFKDDLAKRFPEMKIEVIKADALDLNKLGAQK